MTKNRSILLSTLLILTSFVLIAINLFNKVQIEGLSFVSGFLLVFGLVTLVQTVYRIKKVE